MLKDVVLILLAGIGTAVWFFWRRKAEQAPVFETFKRPRSFFPYAKNSTTPITP
jgi:hypothetical protein